MWAFAGAQAKAQRRITDRSDQSSPMAAACGHLARTVCRRAEREVVALARAEDIRAQPQRYLNRLSDLLFVICRVLARASGHGEVLWQHDRRRKPKPAAE